MSGVILNMCSSLLYVAVLGHEDQGRFVAPGAKHLLSQFTRLVWQSCRTEGTSTDSKKIEDIAIFANERHPGFRLRCCLIRHVTSSAEWHG